MSTYDSFRRRRATNLQKFATALRESSLSCNVNGFNSASAECRSNPPGPSSWGYSLSGVELTNPSPQKHIRPAGASLYKLVLNVQLQGECLSAKEEKGDPLTSLGVEILIVGLDPEGRKIRSSWHMDRHVSDSKIEVPVHPTYHFQFGGMQTKEVDPGRMVISSAPRLAHPPLDAILAIDFLLSNFFHEEWIKLRKRQGHYYSAVKDTQRWLWKPYAKASDTGWDHLGPHYPWQVVEIWPQSIPEEGIDSFHD